MINRPLKILIVSDPYYPYPSGISEYTFYLAKYLKNITTILRYSQHITKMKKKRMMF